MEEATYTLSNTEIGLILTIFIVSIITVYDIRLKQEEMRYGGEPLMVNPILSIPAQLILYISFIILAYLNWKLAIIVFIARFILKIIPVLETIGALLLFPFLKRSD